MSPMNVAFIGIGRMGWHMAGHLVKAGHDVVVCDAVDGVGANWAAEFGGRTSVGPRDAVVGAKFVITSLPADRELRAVAQQIIPHLESGTIWIDHSTTSAEVARETPVVMVGFGTRYSSPYLAAASISSELG